MLVNSQFMQLLSTVADELLRSDSAHTRSVRVVASRTLPHDEEQEEPEVTIMAEAEPANAAPAANLAIETFISSLVSPGAREPENRPFVGEKVSEICGVERAAMVQRLRFGSVGSLSANGSAHCSATKHMTMLLS